VDSGSVPPDIAKADKHAGEWKGKQKGERTS
jgi:hypothetical protein